MCLKQGKQLSKVEGVSLYFFSKSEVSFPCMQDLPIRHTFDPMHCEKNVCNILLRNLLGEIDGPKSREDLQVREICPHLHLQPTVGG